ncbi:DUF4845 domain-containing protein [Wenzhouxiangella sp. AB-CW3]|uniref:DUF4845 domain-containing protein n=1 Tax=Wenzhouxiangella sp. AB-CW3 TaxID=2771012 RepID=UPI00168AE860|nr:DUF4845 domain-containing protein [Wenzhouxiangella sp. AB-CW3]QOC23476.1 DUF4845 domain-containing protein [Wenzhouxiangella sp. AB-CW3]
MTAIERQRGLSLPGFMGLLVLVLFFTYIGIKLVPIYLNHMSVVSEMKAVAEQSGIASETPQAITRQLMDRFNISYVDHVDADHVSIERGDVGMEMVVEYEVETHLIANIDAIVKFQRVERLQD